MARSRPDDLSIGEWAVLALLAEGPTHGFALARALEPEGEIGRVWSFRRPLVYRALATLHARGLAEPKGAQPGSRGPSRTIVGTTATGTRKVARWRSEPVRHVRDVRSQLMLKLLFLERAGADARPLLEAQRAHFEDVADGLRETAAAATGFDRTLALWRLESTRAVVRFIDAESA